jgi:hypothetical protein
MLDAVRRAAEFPRRGFPERTGLLLLSKPCWAYYTPRLKQFLSFLALELLTSVHDNISTGGDGWLMHQNLLLHEVFAVNADIRNTREELAEQGNYLLDRSAAAGSSGSIPTFTEGANKQSAERTTHRNGHRDRRWNTRLGTLQPMRIRKCTT